MLKLKGDGFIEGPRPISPTPADISLQTLLDALPCPIYYKNRDGAYLECNRAFLDQIIGDDNLKITGKSLVDLKGQVPDKLINLYIEKEMELIKKPGQQRYEAEIRCGDGQTRMFTFHNASIQDADGRVVAIAGLMLDMTTTRMKEAELKRYRDKLEEMVTQRSKELAATNNRLSIEIDERRKADKALENSEARYGSIFENNSTATLLIEPDMTISMANAKAEKMAGLSRKAFVGRSKVLEFVTPEHRDRLELYHELRLEGHPDVPRQFEFQLTDGENGVRDVLANMQLLPQTRQTVASLLDITEKNQLQRERQRLAAVIDQSAEAVIITDQHGQVEYVNQAFVKLSGFKREECIGQTLEADFFGDEDRLILKQMTFTVSGTDMWSGRVENLRRAGQAYIADTRIFPICDDRGNAINLVCVKSDVTHEVQLEKLLQQAQKMEAIGTLAGGIAHDFNNILGAIMGYTEISMLNASAEGPLKHNLNRIMDGCQRARELVQNILAFSRKNDEESKPIEIQIVVKEALKLLRATIPSTIEFKQRITAEPSIVQARPTQIHQVILNLCTNAFHAMQSTGGVLEVILENIELTAAQCEGEPDLTPGPHCRLAVRDTGGGINAKTQQRIFEPYFTTKEQTGGTGLGLSVVHGIIKNFGGAISVNSRPGLGTTFDIYLPRVEESLTSDAPAKVSLPNGNECILVADDELFILEIMVEMLTCLGYEVETANGGNEAIEKFSAAPQRYDVVIADLTMPKITGTQLALKIKQIRDDVPIVLTTGMTLDPAAQQDGFKEFAAVMNKPIMYEELAKTLRKVLDRVHHE